MKKSKTSHKQAPKVIGMQYTGSAIIEDGRPAHIAEKITEFDDKVAKVSEMIDGKVREYVYPVSETSHIDPITETDILHMMRMNDKTHHSVMERLMTGLVETHPEMIRTPRTGKVRKTQKRRHASSRNKTQKVK
jgi:hypothetical protein